MCAVPEGGFLHWGCRWSSLWGTIRVMGRADMGAVPPCEFLHWGHRWSFQWGTIREMVVPLWARRRLANSSQRGLCGTSNGAGSAKWACRREHAGAVRAPPVGPRAGLHQGGTARAEGCAGAGAAAAAAGRGWTGGEGRGGDARRGGEKTRTQHA